MPSNHLVLCHPLFLLPSIFPSIRVFSTELALCSKWPKYWSISSSPSSDYSGFISFKIDWFDLLAVQGTLKSLLQHHCGIASVLWCSSFFMVQLSHPYMTAGKTIALTIWTLTIREEISVYVRDIDFCVYVEGREGGREIILGFIYCRFTFLYLC